MRPLLVSALLLTALPATARADYPCALPNIGLDMGLDVIEGSAGSEAFGGAAVVTSVWALARCGLWPIRIEAGLGTTTRGPPWRKGTEAVGVSSIGFDLSALAGPSLVLYSFDEENEIGAEALVGPNFRLRFVNIDVLGRSSLTVAPTVLGRVTAGFYAQLGAIALRVRVTWAFPDDAGVSVLGGVGYQL